MLNLLRETRLTYPHDQQAPTLLGAYPLAGGGAMRYLGYADGVYAQRVDERGDLHELTPYGPWSRWPTSPAAAAIAAAAQAGRRLNCDEAV